MTGETDLVARQGVEAVRLLLLTELGWYPREPVDPDYGVDVYVESAVDGVPDGRMLALQIKSGPSYFRERSETHITYRGSDRHLRYWCGHSLPVVLVLYDPDDRLAYWQAITPETVQDTGKNWKVDVPVSQRVDAASAEALRDLADGDPYLLYLNALRADRSWMQLLDGGGTVRLEIEEWVNKTSGRGEFLIVGTPAGHGESLERTRTAYLGLSSYADVLPRLFGWADLAIDEDLYDMHEEDQWNLDCGAYDSETGTLSRSLSASASPIRDPACQARRSAPVRAACEPFRQRKRMTATISSTLGGSDADIEPCCEGTTTVRTVQPPRPRTAPVDDRRH